MPSNWNKCCKRQTQVPDHGNMRPYRFTVIQSEAGLERFRRLLSKTVTELNFGDDAIKKGRTRRQHGAHDYRRYIRCQTVKWQNPNPNGEQMLTAGCAAYALQLAASAQGFDNVWITGMWVNSPLLREAFECTDKDKIIGLMMIGSPTEEGSGPKN